MAPPLLDPLCTRAAPAPVATCGRDGYAVRAADVARVSSTRPSWLRVVGSATRGARAARPLQAGEAYRVLAGAPLPPGADAVVPYEHTSGRGFGGWTSVAETRRPAPEEAVRVFQPAAPGANVRPAS